MSEEEDRHHLIRHLNKSSDFVSVLLIMIPTSHSVKKSKII